MTRSLDTLDSYLAKLNLEGTRNVWDGNKAKIDFIIGRSTKYVKQSNKVCEIGIGSGYLLDRMHNLGMDCTGVDISEYVIQFLGKKFIDENKKIKLIQTNIANKFDRDDLYDAVFCIDILEHIDEDSYRKAIKNIVKLLKQKGYFILSVPFMENFAPNMTKCSNCNHEFHRIGHKQVFNFDKFKDTIEPYFNIKEFGEVESSISALIRQKTPFYKRKMSLLGIFEKIQHEFTQFFVKRKSNTQKSESIVRPETTCYLIAEKK